MEHNAQPDICGVKINYLIIISAIKNETRCEAGFIVLVLLFKNSTRQSACEKQEIVSSTDRWKLWRDKQ